MVPKIWTRQFAAVLSQGSRRAITISAVLEGGPIDTQVSQAKPWEKLAVVVGNALGAKGAKSCAPMRCGARVEELGADLYNRLGYFERGSSRCRRWLVEKRCSRPAGAGTPHRRTCATDREKDGDGRSHTGDVVRVSGVHPPGARRTPFYIRGNRRHRNVSGGEFANPEELGLWVDRLAEKTALSRSLPPERSLDRLPRGHQRYS